MKKKDLIVRITFGLLYALVILFCTTPVLTDFLHNNFNLDISPKYLFYGLMTLFLLLCMYESTRFMEYDSKIFIVITFLLTGLIYYIFSQKYFNGALSFKFEYQYLLIILLFIIALSIIFKFSNELYNDSSKIIFLTIYIGVPFSLALTIPSIYNGSISFEIFFIFVLIWVSDSFAYLVGSKFGKRKLAPKISPNKSVEGLIGGLFFTIILGIIINYTFIDLKGNWIIISFIVAIAAPIGDLAESKLKRIYNVKDSGKIMPGHGGMLDRLDSFINCIPFIYLYYLIYNNI